MRARYLEPTIRADVKEKMVFLGGPRQVGKTTLARSIASQFSPATYLNWDSRPHRKAIMNAQWSPDIAMLVFDELHKYRRWKTLIKGIWDTRASGQKIMVTGSSRLDIYRRGGDSLQGRYHYYRLHPFTLQEVSAPPGSSLAFPSQPPELEFGQPGSELAHLLKFGGFPEPCLAGSDRTLKRWQRQRFERVFREDIRDVEPLRSLAEVELLGALLPERVAAPLSFNSLATDIEASPKTIKAWVELLCRNYYIFRVPPYHRRLQRALKKESKYYLWDWSEVPGDGARFENLVASHLLKFCHHFQDVFGLAVELFYLRDLEKREADFLLTWEKTPWLIVECKLTAGGSLTALNYFADRLKIKQRFLVVQAEGVDHVDRAHGVRALSASRFLTALV
jgi:predicted AAA+ superfamily ATPase